MHNLKLSTEEVNLLHELMLRALDTNSPVLPECTWQDDCLTCNLFQKVYGLWTEDH